MHKKNFLVEIGTEELPPKTLRTLAESFAKNVIQELNDANLSYDNVKWFATPRRLALKVINLATSQRDHVLEKRGPTINQAFDSQGKPSIAAKNWAKTCGITIEQAKRLTTKKGEWLLHRTYIKGENTNILLPKIIKKSLDKLPIKKSMRWGENNARFVRPVHTITLLFGNDIIPATLFGIKSNRIIRGHRFMGVKQLTIDNADQYPEILIKKGKVIADYEIRKEKIRTSVKTIAKKIGGNVDINENLLEEITALVEWPVALTAKFEKKFLSIPIEVLVHIMKNHHKYFPIYGANGQLLPNFIFIANIESSDPKKIILGNEKIVRPRLMDAEFFFNSDSKNRLEDSLPLLKSVLFQQQLGTLHEKTSRISKLSTWIAEQIGANINHAKRAGLLSKCDLMSNMVFEFKDIRGAIGMHYARRDGEEENVAIALKEQYYPRFSGDTLPSNLVSCSVAIAEKTDTLIGILGINQHPKGDKDPFALRRAALGILRIMVEKNINLDIQTLAEKAIHLYKDKLINIHILSDFIDFMLTRFRVWYKDKGYNNDTIQAVLTYRSTRPTDLHARIEAISYFKTLKEASALITTNKRISSILTKSKETLNETVDLTILKEVAEIRLANKLAMLDHKLKTYFSKSRYQEALFELTSLSKPVDEFFKQVMVNTTIEIMRINRLTLLSKLQKLFLKIADISVLQQ